MYCCVWLHLLQQNTAVGFRNVGVHLLSARWSVGIAVTGVARTVHVGRLSDVVAFFCFDHIECHLCVDADSKLSFKVVS